MKLIYCILLLSPDPSKLPLHVGSEYFSLGWRVSIKYISSGVVHVTEFSVRSMSYVSFDSMLYSDFIAVHFYQTLSLPTITWRLSKCFLPIYLNERCRQTSTRGGPLCNSCLCSPHLCRIKFLGGLLLHAINQGFVKLNHRQGACLCEGVCVLGAFFFFFCLFCVCVRACLPAHHLLFRQTGAASTVYRVGRVHPKR